MGLRNTDLVTRPTVDKTQSPSHMFVALSDGQNFSLEVIYGILALS